MLWKCCTQYARKYGKLSSGRRTGKGQFSFRSQRKAMPKSVQTTMQLHSFHMLAVLMLKNSPSQASTVHELMYCSNVQAGFRKGIGIRGEIANICWIIEKAREFQKNIYFCLIDYAKSIDCVNHNKLENSSRDGNTSPPYVPPRKPVCRSRCNS